MITQTSTPSAITIRRAVPEDAEGITRTYMESAEHHASLDSELYRPNSGTDRTFPRQLGRDVPPYLLLRF
jgi:hypothetical protein